ncbi:TPA: phage gp6-like head-tail connector protein [Citrobacter farmeri]|nr:phage gp6-like head-tail connector protein [Citrobacter farmeri]
MPQIKKQLRLDDDFIDEDDILVIYGNSAERAAVKFLNRKIYPESVPETDPDGITIEDDIRLAMLMTVSHWYKNRGPVTPFEQAEIPMTWRFLLNPYRIIPI